MAKQYDENQEEMQCNNGKQLNYLQFTNEFRYFLEKLMEMQ